MPVIDFHLLCGRSGVAVRGVRLDADYRAQGFQGTGISRAARITRSCHLQSAFGHAAEFHPMALRSEMVGRCAPQWCGTETGRETDYSCLGAIARFSFMAKAIVSARCSSPAPFGPSSLLIFLTFQRTVYHPRSFQNACSSCLQAVSCPINAKNCSLSSCGTIGSSGMEKVSITVLSASILKTSIIGSSP